MDLRASLRARSTRSFAGVACAILVGCLLAAPGRGGGGPAGPTFGYGSYAAEARALGYCNVYTTAARYRPCAIRQLLRLVEQAPAPVRELPRIDAYAREAGGYLEASCHILMHSVGRRFAAAKHLTLARLQRYLPRTNDPGCSAGFAHGMITYLGPQIVRSPQAAARTCDRAPTRYQRYSCVHGLGHAYARIYLDALLPAIAACAALGSRDAADCAQGAYMDYWMSRQGFDGTRRPAGGAPSRRAVCAGAPTAFVLPCWYRAFSDNPPARPIDSARKLLAACRGLAARQRAGCVAGASLVVSADPFRQMQVCSALSSPDAASCIRGVRAPATALGPPAERMRLIRSCASVPDGAQYECYWWLGKALNVVENGRFERDGCQRLLHAATRQACATGAAGYEGPLETFS